MVKFFAYYSFGGYKELYLGHNQETDKEKYYLPMVPVLEKQALEEQDTALLAKVQELRSLPQIVNIGIKDDNNLLPPSTSTMISHGGYEVLYKTIERGRQALSVRNIIAKDEMGRPAPFLFMLTADDDEGYAILDEIASFLLHDIVTFRSRVATMFAYDATKNGLRFNLGEFNALLVDIHNSSKTVTSFHKFKSAHLIVAEDLSLALDNQSLDKSSLFLVVSPTGQELFKAIVEASSVAIRKGSSQVVIPPEKPKHNNGSDTNKESNEDKETPSNNTLVECAKKYKRVLIYTAAIAGISFLLGVITCRSCTKEKTPSNQISIEKNK